MILLARKCCYNHPPALFSRTVLSVRQAGWSIYPLALVYLLLCLSSHSHPTTRWRRRRRRSRTPTLSAGTSSKGTRGGPCTSATNSSCALTSISSVRVRPSRQRASKKTETNPHCLCIGDGHKKILKKAKDFQRDYALVYYFGSYDLYGPLLSSRVFRPL
jgi:hypothetical protein